VKRTGAVSKSPRWTGCGDDTGMPGTTAGSDGLVYDLTTMEACMKKLCMILMLVFSTVCIASNAFAFGLGLYGTGGGGTATNFGGGFWLDTCLADDSIFNYRMSFGVDTNDYSGISQKGARLHLFNDFGFGVVRNSYMRLWLGPQLLVAGVFSGAKGVNVGLGLAVGLNINVGDYVSLCIEGAGRGMVYYRNYTSTEPNIPYIMATGKYAVEDIDHSESDIGGGFTFSIGVMFRINDRYSR